MNLSFDDDPVAGSAAAKSVDMTVFEALSGGATNDLLRASTTQTNEIRGAGGDDILRGGGLADTLDGGTGDDILYGAEGSDVLTGGDGADSIFGGTDGDVAAFAGAMADYLVSDLPGTRGVGVARRSDGVTDLLLDVETARFTDGDVDLSPFVSGGILDIFLIGAALDSTLGDVEAVVAATAPDDTTPAIGRSAASATDDAKSGAQAQIAALRAEIAPLFQDHQRTDDLDLFCSRRIAHGDDALNGVEGVTARLLGPRGQDQVGRGRAGRGPVGGAALRRAAARDPVPSTQVLVTIAGSKTVGDVTVSLDKSFGLEAGTIDLDAEATLDVTFDYAVPILIDLRRANGDGARCPC